MAVDSEARSSGSSAIIIALVAIVLVVAGAFAFMNSNRTTEVVGVPTSGTTTVINPPAAPSAPDVHIDVPSPPVVVDGGSSGSSTTTTKTETKTGN